jgi:hypothetical protein
VNVDGNVRAELKNPIRQEIFCIGNSVTCSGTMIPQLSFNRRTGLNIIDCPGFLDNRGPEIDISNNSNILNCLKSAKSIKIIILIDYPSF